MLRCLGISLTRPTDLLGGNFGVVQSAEIRNGELTKKHIAISYHYVWAAIAAKIVNAHWCGTHETFADLCTTANMFFGLNAGRYGITALASGFERRYGPGTGAKQIQQ